MSDREINRLVDAGVNVRRTAPSVEYYSWVNPKTGQSYQIPKGIDPGWDYNVGKVGFKNGGL